jgi:hypothetical protein
MPDCVCASDERLWDVDVTDGPVCAVDASDFAIGACYAADLRLFSVICSDNAECC